MASENEASCESDPNFAVICGFLEKFSVTCSLAKIDFVDLQEMLENTQEVSQELIELHVKLMRRARRSVASNDRWERALIKTCHTFSNQDAWEIERFGYKKARISSKLRILKELLEMQFDYNQKFKSEINKISSDDLRTQPLGRDRFGKLYWYQCDESCQVRVYKDDPDDETWSLVAKDRSELVSLISQLGNGDTTKSSSEPVSNEDSNSVGVEKPILDTGQSKSSSPKSSNLDTETVDMEDVPMEIESDLPTTTLIEENRHTSILCMKDRSQKVIEEKPTENIQSSSNVKEISTVSGYINENNRQSEEVKKDETELKKNKAELKNSEDELKKNETEIKKNDVELKKIEAELKKEETKLKNNEGEFKEDEAKLKKDEIELTKDETELKKAEAALKKNEAESEHPIIDSNEDVSTAKNVPTLADVPTPEGVSIPEDVPTPEDVSIHDDVPTPEGVPIAEDVPTPEGVTIAEDVPTPEGVPFTEDVPTPEGVPISEDVPTPEDINAKENASENTKEKDIEEIKESKNETVQVNPIDHSKSFADKELAKENQIRKVETAFRVEQFHKEIPKDICENALNLCSKDLSLNKEESSDDRTGLDLSLKTGPSLRIKPITELMAQPQHIMEMQKKEFLGIKGKYIRNDADKGLMYPNPSHLGKAVQSASFDAICYKRTMQDDIYSMPTNLKHPRFDRPTLLGNNKYHHMSYMDDDEDDEDDDEVEDEIEEPLMLVHGEGSGYPNESGNDAVSPIIGEEIEEDILFVFGEGNGEDCDTGNNLEGSDEKEQKESSDNPDTSPPKSPYKLGTIIDTKTDKVPTKNLVKKSRWDVRENSADSPQNLEIVNKISENRLSEDDSEKFEMSDDAASLSKQTFFFGSRTAFASNISPIKTASLSFGASTVSDNQNVETTASISISEKHDEAECSNLDKTDQNLIGNNPPSTNKVPDKIDNNEIVSDGLSSNDKQGAISKESASLNIDTDNINETLTNNNSNSSDNSDINKDNSDSACSKDDLNEVSENADIEPSESTDNEESESSEPTEKVQDTPTQIANNEDSPHTADENILETVIPKENLEAKDLTSTKDVENNSDASSSKIIPKDEVLSSLEQLSPSDENHGTEDEEKLPIPKETTDITQLEEVEEVKKVSESVQSNLDEPEEIEENVADSESESISEDEETIENSRDPSDSEDIKVDESSNSNKQSLLTEDKKSDTVIEEDAAEKDIESDEDKIVPLEESVSNIESKMAKDLNPDSEVVESNENNSFDEINNITPISDTKDMLLETDSNHEIKSNFPNNESIDAQESSVNKLECKIEDSTSQSDKVDEDITKPLANELIERCNSVNKEADDHKENKLENETIESDDTSDGDIANDAEDLLSNYEDDEDSTDLNSDNLDGNQPKSEQDSQELESDKNESKVNEQPKLNENKPLESNEKRLISHHKRMELDEKSLESNDTPIESGDKPMESDDEPTESNDKLTESFDKPIESDDKHMETDDKTVESRNLPIEPYEKTIESNDEHMESDEKHVEINDKYVESNHKPIKSYEKCKKSDENSIKSNKKSVKSNVKLMESVKKSVESHEKPKESDNKPIESDEKSMKSDAKLIHSIETPIGSYEKPIQSEPHLESNDKPIEPCENPTKSDGKPVEPNDKPMELGDKPVGKSIESNDKSMELADKPTKSDDKLLESGETSIESNDKSLQLTDKAMKSDKLTESNDRPIKSNENSVKSSERAIKLDEKSAKSNENPIKSYEKSEKSDEKPAKSDEKSVKSSEKIVKSSEKSGKSGEKYVKSYEKSVKSDEKSVKSVDKYVKSDEKSVISAEKSVKSSEKSVKLDEESVKSDKKVVKSDGKFVKSNENPIKSDDKLVKSDKKTVKSDDNAIKSIKKPVESDEKPIESVEKPDEEQLNLNKNEIGSHKESIISDKQENIIDQTKLDTKKHKMQPKLKNDQIELRKDRLRSDRQQHNRVETIKTPITSNEHKESENIAIKSGKKEQKLNENQLESITDSLEASGERKRINRDEKNKKIDKIPSLSKNESIKVDEELNKDRMESNSRLRLRPRACKTESKKWNFSNTKNQPKSSEKTPLVASVNTKEIKLKSKLNSEIVVTPKENRKTRSETKMDLEISKTSKLENEVDNIIETDDSNQIEGLISSADSPSDMCDNDDSQSGIAAIKAIRITSVQAKCEILDDRISILPINRDKESTPNLECSVSLIKMDLKDKTTDPQPLRFVRGRRPTQMLSVKSYATRNKNLVLRKEMKPQQIPPTPPAPVEKPKKPELPNNMSQIEITKIEENVGVNLRRSSRRKAGEISIEPVTIEVVKKPQKANQRKPSEILKEVQKKSPEIPKDIHRKLLEIPKEIKQLPEVEIRHSKRLRLSNNQVSEGVDVETIDLTSESDSKLNKKIISAKDCNQGFSRGGLTINPVVKDVKEESEISLFKRNGPFLTCVNIQKLKENPIERPVKSPLAVESPGGGDSSDVVIIEDDPLAITHEVTVKPLTLSSLELDLEFEPPASIITRSLRKRARPEPEIVLPTGGKRRKTKGKRQVDLELRRSIEEQKKQEVSSSEEEKKEESPKRKPSHKIKKPEIHNAVEKEPQPKKPRAPKKKTLLGLDIPEDINQLEDVGSNVRQSRRIAQIKIKEEAERRKIDDITMVETKEPKKKSKKDIDKDYKAEKRKRSKAPTEEEVTVDVPEVEEKKTKRKRKRKHRDPRKIFDEANPWRSSSDSSSSNDEVEEEEEIAEYSEPDSPLFRSDHEFSPESDIEEASVAQPLKRARTARKEDNIEDDIDEHACQKCGKSDHPEWILLCDGCDNGWHCSCLRPALFIIPEGDWFCPPCQHNSLVKQLEKKLDEFDKKMAKRQIEVRRKQRLAYVGISLANVLPVKDNDDRRKKKHAGEDYDEESESESSSDSSSSSDSDEPIYQLRQRRQAHSYRFNDYDDLINSAIQDEMDAAVKGAGNQGRGKDIATIINAEMQEKAEAEKIHQEVQQQQPQDDKQQPQQPEPLPPVVPVELPPAVVPPQQNDSEEETSIRPVKKFLGRKKQRRLNCLDVSSGDDAASDEDFKGSSSDDEDDFDEDLGSDSSDAYGRRKRGMPIRRSTRARTSRYDRDFINDDTDDDIPKKKKSRTWDESESEESDRSWGRTTRKKTKRFSAPRKKRSKKSKKYMDESDEDRSKKKKRRIKYGGLDDDDEEEEIGRKTRGKKINYADVLASDSDEEEKKRRPPPRIESDDDYDANEDQNDEDDEKEEGAQKEVAPEIVEKPVTKEAEEKLPPPVAETPQSDIPKTNVPEPSNAADHQQEVPPKDTSIPPQDNFDIDNLNSSIDDLPDDIQDDIPDENDEDDDELNPIEEINKNLEEMDEEEMEKLMEEEEYANKQLQLMAMQLEREKKRKEREAKKKEKEIPGTVTPESKVPKKRGRKAKVAETDEASSTVQIGALQVGPDMQTNPELSEPPGITIPIFSEIPPTHVDDSPRKRRGRGKGKKTLEKEAAAAAALAIAAASLQDSDDMESFADQVRPLEKQESHIPTTVETVANVNDGDLSNAPGIHGGKLAIAAPPQPFSQTQPQPSVITRMLQGQSGQTNYPNLGMGLNYYADQPPLLDENSQTPPPPSNSQLATSAPVPSSTPVENPNSGLPPMNPQYMHGGPPRGIPPTIYRPPPSNINPYQRSSPAPPPVRVRTPAPSIPPAYHSHHSMDPSPSGGGAANVPTLPTSAINTPERNSPVSMPPSSVSPLSNKSDPTPPPPPYSRPQARFPSVNATPLMASSPIRQQNVIPPQHIQPQPPVPLRNNLPYPANMPPNYFGGFMAGGGIATDEGLPPVTFQYGDQFSETNSPQDISKTFEEENSGEFGGLVSYFSSQREDDLDT